MNKCVFLDRDGVLNRERGDYAYLPEHFELEPGIREAVDHLKASGYILVVVTNQAGISKGLFTREQMQVCHDILQKHLNGKLDHIYYAPYHPSVTESLSRKPDTLMFEKAIARFRIDPAASWLIGDSDRDIQAAQKLNIRTIKIGAHVVHEAPDFYAENLLQACRNIQ
jgi:D-glycero-D-manno-heptose 1,7-bisphosphate phosphatase